MPFVHTYLFVTADDSFYVQEGYPIPQQGGPDYLGVVKSATGINDHPGIDPSFGTVAGTFVCGWLPTLDAAAAKITSDKIAFNTFGPNSSTAMYYMLSQLPTTFTSWFNFGLVYPIGWNAYRF